MALVVRVAKPDDLDCLGSTMEVIGDSQLTVPIGVVWSVILIDSVVHLPGYGWHDLCD